jgi:hypothetical protein
MMKMHAKQMLFQPIVLSFKSEDAVDRCEFDGEARPVFRTRDFRFSYEERGYETIEPAGAERDEVRYCPRRPGLHRWAAYRGATLVAEGSFDVQEASGGFVRVSARDPRYFETEDGAVFVPNGLNLAFPSAITLSAGSEFAKGAGVAFYGIREYERWFRKLAENGGNFARIWLSNRYFALDGEGEGSVTDEGLARFDAVVEAARTYGIRLTVSFEHFRRLRTSEMAPAEEWVTPNATFFRAVVDPDTGTSPEDMDEWYNGARWQELWLRKIRAIADRYADDPAIAVWELWNEINCCKTSAWEVQRAWTERTLKTVAQLFPRQLVANSLGGYERDAASVFYDDFKSVGLPFTQVHRYLDPGSPMLIVRTDPIAASMDAIRRSALPDRPALLAETGAVNDNHTGVFSQCRRDERGIILHDTLFAPFFAGSAGPGHHWFWDERYVDMRNLWYHFRLFADLIAGTDPREEAFKPFEFEKSGARGFGLAGQRTTLVWVRNSADTWQNTLRDQIEPTAIPALEVPVPAAGDRDCQYVKRIWESTETAGLPEDRPAGIRKGILSLPGFKYGLLMRLTAPL